MTQVITILGLNNYEHDLMFPPTANPFKIIPVNFVRIL